MINTIIHLSQVAIKAGLYRKAVQVYDIPKLYPVTHSWSFHMKFMKLAKG